VLAHQLHGALETLALGDTRASLAPRRLDLGKIDYLRHLRFTLRRDDYRSSRACVKLSAQLPARATLLRQSPMPTLGHPSHLPRHPVENLDLARRQSAASENLADREHDMLRVVVGNKTDRDQRLRHPLEHRVAHRRFHEMRR